MAKDVGQTILDAAKQVVEQFSRQNQLQLQQLAMEQQFAVQSQLMDLRSKQADAQAKLNDLQLQAGQLDLENKRKQAQLFDVTGGVQGAAERQQKSTDLSVREAEAKIKLVEAQTGKAIADSKPKPEDVQLLGVAGLKPKEKIELRAGVIAKAESIHEEETLASLTSVKPEYQKFGLLSMEDLKETQREVNRVATRGGSITDLLQSAIIKDNPQLAKLIAAEEATQGVNIQQLQTDLTSLVQEAAGAVASGPNEETINRAAVASGVLPNDLQTLFPGGYSTNPQRSAAVKLFGAGAFKTPGFYSDLNRAVQNNNYATFLTVLRDTGVLPASGSPTPEKQAALNNYLLETFQGDSNAAAQFLRSVLQQRAKEQ